jgi:hypothetical protein
MDDQKLRRDFENCSLDPSLFDHRNHLRLGWLYVRDFSPATAIEKFTDNLRRYTRHVGAEHKYNETISWFYMLMIAERQQLKPSTTFDAFVSLNPDLLAPDALLLKRAYRPETLDSEQARNMFILPDAHNPADMQRLI